MCIDRERNLRNSSRETTINKTELFALLCSSKGEIDVRPYHKANILLTFESPTLSPSGEIIAKISLVFVSAALPADKAVRNIKVKNFTITASLFDKGDFM